VVVSHHVGDPQVFVIDHIVRPHQREGCLVVKVCPLAAHCLMRLRENTDSFAPAIAPALATTDTALAFGELPLGLAITAGRKNT
jgi:hypothetical protein